MATKTRIQKSVNRTPKSAAVNGATPIEKLVGHLIKATHKLYGVELIRREEREQRAIYYALRETLGREVSGKAGNKFNWQVWSQKVFPKFFGEPDDIKYSARMMAQIAAALYHTIPVDPEAAIAELVRRNQESLNRRNGQSVNDEEIDDILDDELDDEEEPLAELDDELGDEEEDEFGF